MKLRKSFVSAAIAYALVGFVGAPAVAGTIESWNTGNVVTTPGLDADGNGFSVIYDQPTVDGVGAATSAYIKFTPPETMSPGLEVENSSIPGDGTTYSGGDVYNCILSAGPSSCNSEFQSGKRFKLDRTAFDPVDLVFNVDPSGEFPATIDQSVNDGLYKVFQKYGNNTDARIESFTVELGFGIGDAFIASTAGDGLGFVDFGADPKNNQFSSLFAAGLFGPVDPPQHPLEGYFSDQRAGFNLDLVSEDLFASAGMFGVYDDLFGDWLSYSQVPNGFFYDDDGDALTDAILMANQESDGSWSVNRGILADGSVVTLAEADQLTDLSLAEVEAALNANIALPTCSGIAGEKCLAGVDAIEDLAKFNLTYFIDQILLDPTAIVDEQTGLTMGDLLLTAYADAMTFTLRISAVEAVPAPGVLALLGLGLLGMFGAKQRRDVRA